MERILKTKQTVLEMVFPPISNREVAKLRGEKAIESRLSQSDFYMAATKPHGEFCNIREIPGAIKFDIKIKDVVVGSGGINLLDFLATARHIGISCSKSAITVWATDRNRNHLRMLDRYTPEGAIWRRSRFDSDISGLDNYEELSTYDLLYIGIAPKSNSYDRVISQVHHARLSILSEEATKTPGAHISDELFFFFFQLHSNYIYVNSMMEDDSKGVNLDLSPQKQVLADAEKAFVKLLDPKYNTIKYKGYPRGTDGLYSSGLHRYQYLIQENLIFNAPAGRFRGGRRRGTDPLTNLADYIMVSGDEVQIYISGRDFDSTDN
jgi:hypothetical protein